MNNKFIVYVVIACVVMIIIGGLIVMTKSNVKDVNNSTSKIVNGSVVNIPNTNKTCISTEVRSDGLYCNVDNITG